MGDRVSISFVNGGDESVALFSHWGGMSVVKDAETYVKALKKWAGKDEVHPLQRLEPQTVMVDFIRYYTKKEGLERVEGDLYLGVDGGDGDNSDNGHHRIELSKHSKEEVIKEFEETKDKAELRALSEVSLERPLTDKEFAKMKQLSKKVYGVK